MRKASLINIGVIAGRMPTSQISLIILALYHIQITSVVLTQVYYHYTIINTLKSQHTDYNYYLVTWFSISVSPIVYQPC